MRRIKKSVNMMTATMRTGTKVETMLDAEFEPLSRLLPASADYRHCQSMLSCSESRCCDIPVVAAVHGGWESLDWPWWADAWCSANKQAARSSVSREEEQR